MKKISIWTDGIKDVRMDSLKENIECDILVIGGGIAGLSTVYNLKDMFYYRFNLFLSIVITIPSSVLLTAIPFVLFAFIELLLVDIFVTLSLGFISLL